MYEKVKAMSDEELIDYLNTSNDSVSRVMINWLVDIKFHLLAENFPIFTITVAPEEMAKRMPEVCWSLKHKHTVVRYNLNWVLNKHPVWLFTHYAKSQLRQLNEKAMETYEENNVCNVTLIRR
jgi:hypothetical protein